MANTTMNTLVAGTNKMVYAVPVNCIDSERFKIDFEVNTLAIWLAKVKNAMVTKKQAEEKALAEESIDVAKVASIQSDLETLQKDFTAIEEKVREYDPDLAEKALHNAPAIVIAWANLANHVSPAEWLSEYNTFVGNAFTVCINDKAKQTEKDKATKALNNRLHEIFAGEEGYFDTKKTTINPTAIDEIKASYLGDKAKLVASGKGIRKKATEKSLDRTLAEQTILQVAIERLEFAKVEKGAKFAGTRRI